MEIRTKTGEIIIIDSGSGIRRLGNKLLDQHEYKYHMIFTHAHWDHILGFPFFRPIYNSNTYISMHGCSFAQNALNKIVSKTMEPPHFPVEFREIEAEITFCGTCKKEFTIDTLEITPIHLSHPNHGAGYKFNEDGKEFVFLTDNELSYKHPGGYAFEDYVEFTKGVDFLIHDAEYSVDDYSKKKTWGHSTYNDAVKLALEAGVKSLGLFHHNQNRSDTDIDQIVEECREMLKRGGSDATCFALTQETEIEL